MKVLSLIRDLFNFSLRRLHTTPHPPVWLPVYVLFVCRMSAQRKWSLHYESDLFLLDLFFCVSCRCKRSRQQLQSTEIQQQLQRPALSEIQRLEDVKESVKSVESVKNATENIINPNLAQTQFNISLKTNIIRYFVKFVLYKGRTELWQNCSLNWTEHTELFKMPKDHQFAIVNPKLQFYIWDIL